MTARSGQGFRSASARWLAGRPSPERGVDAFVIGAGGQPMHAADQTDLAQCTNTPGKRPLSRPALVKRFARVQRAAQRIPAIHARSGARRRHRGWRGPVRAWRRRLRGSPCGGRGSMPRACREQHRIPARPNRAPPPPAACPDPAERGRFPPRSDTAPNWTPPCRIVAMGAVGIEIAARGIGQRHLGPVFP